MTIGRNRVFPFSQRASRLAAVCRVLFLAVSFVALLPLSGPPINAQQTSPAPAPKATRPANAPDDDPLARAAVGAGEPPLQTILDRLGYSVDTRKDEVSVQRFVRAGRGKVMVTPLSAFGLLKVCHAGWYVARAAASEGGQLLEPPRTQELWRVAAPDNKQDTPPMMRGGHCLFDPAEVPFGFYVQTEGFSNETVCTEDALQALIPRFPATDRHKARVYRAKRNGRVVPNAYIIGWEYSTNNDFQDMVTLVYNVKPYPPLPDAAPPSGKGTARTKR